MPLVTDLKAFYADDGMATNEEINMAFKKVLDSWKEEVFKTVPKESIPCGSNIIASHVVYIWKDRNTPRQRLKARIVPHSSRDKDNDTLRAESPPKEAGNHEDYMFLLCRHEIRTKGHGY